MTVLPANKFEAATVKMFIKDHESMLGRFHKIINKSYRVL